MAHGLSEHDFAGYLRHQQACWLWMAQRLLTHDSASWTVPGHPAHQQGSMSLIARSDWRQGAQSLLHHCSVSRMSKQAASCWLQVAQALLQTCFASWMLMQAAHCWLQVAQPLLRACFAFGMAPQKQIQLSLLHLQSLACWVWLAQRLLQPGFAFCTMPQNSQLSPPHLQLGVDWLRVARGLLRFCCASWI